MNKNLIRVIIICLVVILCVGGIVVFNSQREDPPIVDLPGPSQEPDDDILAEDVIVRDVPFENHTDTIYISCLYPAVSSLKDKEFESYINNQIAININQYIEEIGYIVDDETLPTAMYRYVTTYDRYNCGKYLSLVINQDYQTGGIRSNKWKDIYNINVETERIFYLNELFKPGVKYDEAIISEITKQAEAKNYELKGGNGLTKLPTKQKFYIKDDKLVIYFDPSEAAANVFGVLHFEMPFTMNEEGFFEI